LTKDEVLKIHLKQRDENSLKKLSVTLASLHLDLAQHIEQDRGFHELEGWFNLQPDEKKFKSNLSDLSVPHLDPCIQSS